MPVQGTLLNTITRVKQWETSRNPYQTRQKEIKPKQNAKDKIAISNNARGRIELLRQTDLKKVNNAVHIERVFRKKL